MARLFAILMLCALGLFAAPARAQAPAHIAFGQRLSATATTEGGEFWAFAGLQDTRVQVQLGLPGALGAVTLYDANGEELARAEGEGIVSLQHTLPADGIYLLGVTSAVRGKDFALAFDGKEPEPMPEPAGADVAAPPALALAPVPAPGAATRATADSTAPAPATASPPTTTPVTPAFVADPSVWGIYARLAGRRTVEVPGIYWLSWVWSKPGEELVEQWLDGTGKVVHTNTLTPTGTPGQLLQHASYLGGKEWLGKVGQDGRVTYVGRGLLKWPFVAEISPEGVFQMRRAKVDGEGNPVRIDEPMENARWTLAPVGSGGS